MVASPLSGGFGLDENKAFDMRGNRPVDSIKICSRCIFDSRISGIYFDGEGICQYCRQIEQLSEQYGTGNPKGESSLRQIIRDIKRRNCGGKYDCVVGVSGGTDSSFLLMKSQEWGLRPLAVHYDNTWNTATATQNIAKVTSVLNVDLVTHVVNNREADDIFRSFFLAGVPEFDASTDIALAQVLRATAAKYGIKYILEGHSFMAEGISPQECNYFDGRYIADVHRQFGRGSIETYPNLTFARFIKWTLFYRQKFIRPLWYCNYSKAKAQEILTKKTGWKYYGGHHLENRATAFLHTVHNPQSFGIDNRNWSLAAEVRSGFMARDDALAIYRKPIEPDPELVAYVKKRLTLSDDEYTAAMNGPRRTFRDFKNNKKRFERLRLLFHVLAKANLVPMSFYLKYCFPIKEVD